MLGSVVLQVHHCHIGQLRVLLMEQARLGVGSFCTRRPWRRLLGLGVRGDGSLDQEGSAGDGDAQLGPSSHSSLSQPGRLSHSPPLTLKGEETVGSPALLRGPDGACYSARGDLLRGWERCRFHGPRRGPHATPSESSEGERRSIARVGETEEKLN